MTRRKILEHMNKTLGDTRHHVKYAVYISKFLLHIEVIEFIRSLGVAEDQINSIKEIAKRGANREIPHFSALTNELIKVISSPKTFVILNKIEEEQETLMLYVGLVGHKHHLARDHTHAKSTVSTVYSFDLDKQIMRDLEHRLLFGTPEDIYHLTCAARDSREAFIASIDVQKHRAETDAYYRKVNGR